MENKIVLAIIAIFLPPVAAYIKVKFTTHFFVNIVLCLFGFLPGVIHALYLVLLKD